MSKRKLVSDSSSSSAAQLRLYQKSYKGGGVHDTHHCVFQKAKEFMQRGHNDDKQVQTNDKNNYNNFKVLYPGCHRHLTASFIFSDVTYVDCDAKVAPLYQEEAAKDFVEQGKMYPEKACYSFYCANVCDPKACGKKPFAKPNTYNVLISLSAGLLAMPCTPYVQRGGWLLVNDSHSDARHVYVHGCDDWQLRAYWDEEDQVFGTDQLADCFRVVDKKKAKKQQGKDKDDVTVSAMTAAHVQESLVVGAVSKRSFTMPMTSNFYLFQRKK